MSYKSEQDNARRLYQNAEKVRAFLDRLDEKTEADGGANMRRSTRYPYRVRSLSVEISQAGTGWIRYEVPSRNLSCEGASFLLGHFAYPGSFCRINLISLRNQRRTIAAKIVRCRYIEGSGTLHEVGVQFDEAIDIAEFNREAARLRGALINDEPGVRRLAEHWLKSLDVDLHCLDNPSRLIDVVNAEKYQFILLDMELGGFSALTLAHELRMGGYIQLLVAVTESTDAGFHEQCLAAGCNRILLKPYTREALGELLESLRAEPIFSSLREDGSLMQLIETFIHDLGRRMQQLESAFSDRDYEALAAIVKSLKGEGGAHGFQAITDAAAQIEKTLATQQSPADIRKELNELVRICSSARSK